MPAASPRLIPSVPILAAKPRNKPRLNWNTPSPSDRDWWTRRHRIDCDWTQVDFSVGRFLYIGKAQSFLTRLHPRSHPFWWIPVPACPTPERLFLLLWSVGFHDAYMVESWLINYCDPLCNTTGGSWRSRSTDYIWRDPDLVAPYVEFDPKQREDGPPVSSTTGGVYAWAIGSDLAWITIARNHTRLLSSRTSFPIGLVPPPLSSEMQAVSREVQVILYDLIDHTIEKNKKP